MKVKCKECDWTAIMEPWDPHMEAHHRKTGHTEFEETKE